jgi:hypothetical protein
LKHERAQQNPVTMAENLDGLIEWILGEIALSTNGKVNRTAAF